MGEPTERDRQWEAFGESLAHPREATAEELAGAAEHNAATAGTPRDPDGSRVIWCTAAEVQRAERIETLARTVLAFIDGDFMATDAQLAEHDELCSLLGIEIGPGHSPPAHGGDVFDRIVENGGAGCEP